MLSDGDAPFLSLSHTHTDENYAKTHGKVHTEQTGTFRCKKKTGRVGGISRRCISVSHTNRTM